MAYKYKYLMIPCEDNLEAEKLLKAAINERIDKLVVELHKESCGTLDNNADEIMTIANQIAILVKQRNHMFSVGSNDMHGISDFQYDDRLRLLWE